MPDAIDAGILETRPEIGLINPVTMMARAVTMKAPTPCCMVKPVLAPISAKPGVDHAVMIGIL
jgi:hypothetical protein